MKMLDDVRSIVSSALQLGTRGHTLGESSGLLGTLPELDSMAVVTLLTALEERFDISIEDDEISSDNLATLGDLARFVESKMDG